MTGLAEWELDADANMGVVLSCTGEVSTPLIGSCEIGYQCDAGSTFDDCCPEGCSDSCGCPICKCLVC